MILPVGFGSEEAAGGYQIERSLRFNSADSAYLNRTASSPTDGKKATMSFWIKKCDISTDTNESYRSIFYCGTPNVDGLRIAFARYGGYDNHELNIAQDNGSSAAYFGLRTTQFFRDTSAWYHFVIRYDSTDATANNRVRLYVNGSEITSFISRTNAPLNHIPSWQINGTTLKIGKGRDDVNEHIDMYLTEVHFIDGSALDPTSFGEFNSDTGVWQPKAYTGSYGTNGFYLNFSDNSGVTSTTLGADSSGNGNNWTPNNFSVTAGAGNDSLVDTPTNYGTDTGVGGEVRGNYATINAVDKNSQIALANGNLDYTNSSTNANTQARATIAYPSTGNWYFESTRGGGGSSFAAGIGTSTTSLGTQNAGIIMYNEAGQIYVDGVLNSTPGTTFASGDTMGVAVDMDAAKVYWYKNGVVINASGLSFTVGSSTWMPMIGCYTNGDTGTLNFGQRAFANTAPSGFKALCTQNLPEPTIVDGGEYFNTVLWSGNGSTQSISGVGFQPDMVWVKSRNAAYGNGVIDVVRGVGNQVLTESTLAESYSAARLTSFDIDGFSAGDAVGWNASSTNYVAWNWKANGAGVSNTDGTITSTVSANTDSGFSIVTYTGNATNGATVGHGLGVAPSMIIIKGRFASNWSVYHALIPNATTSILILNSTSAVVGSLPTYWNSTAPTSTVFSLGSDSNINSTNADGLVAYCFAAKESYSSAFSFTGNGSTDGSFVFLGFRPAWVLIKRTDTTGNWTILDFQREGYNVDNDPLYPNLSNAEGTTDLADLLSNGFKLRTTDASVNASGGTYIGFAVAQNPFKYSLGR